MSIGVKTSWRLTRPPGGQAAGHLSGRWRDKVGWTDHNAELERLTVDAGPAPNGLDERVISVLLTLDVSDADFAWRRPERWLA
jgi:hypothetical protein